MIEEHTKILKFKEHFENIKRDFAELSDSIHYEEALANVFLDEIDLVDRIDREIKEIEKIF